MPDPQPRQTLASLLQRPTGAPVSTQPYPQTLGPRPQPMTLADMVKAALFGGVMGFPSPYQNDYPYERAAAVGEGLSLGAPLLMAGAAKLLSKQQMLARGADGYLTKAVEMHVPLNKVSGLEPTPAGDYRPGRQITQPIEVAYDAAQDKYMLYSGNHRVTQAKMNGQATIPAFVEPDKGKVR